jgi:hypothetical protein
MGSTSVRLFEPEDEPAGPSFGSLASRLQDFQTSTAFKLPDGQRSSAFKLQDDQRSSAFKLQDDQRSAAFKLQDDQRSSAFKLQDYKRSSAFKLQDDQRSSAFWLHDDLKSGVQQDEERSPPASRFDEVQKSIVFPESASDQSKINKKPGSQSYPLPAVS